MKAVDGISSSLESDSSSLLELGTKSESESFPTPNGSPANSATSAKDCMRARRVRIRGRILRVAAIIGLPGS